MGDFNVNLLGNRPSVRFLQQLLIQHNCIQLVENPTRVTDHSESLLDLLITNFDRCYSDTEVLSFGFSDHSAVSCSFSLRHERPRACFRTLRSFHNFQLDDFLSDASLIDWDRVYHIHSLDAKADYFAYNLLTLFDKYAPLKVVRVNSSKVRNPWFTGTLQILRKLVRGAWLKYVRSRLSSDRSYLANLRNYYNRALILEKRAQFLNTN